ncbi:MAG: hypothetical protein RIQ52_558 [Pseudomonadota bacterium]|jgi:putative ABC transport system ATP-binding protein
MSSHIELIQVKKHYEQTDSAVLKSIDLRISQGEFLAVVGPSGNGKSTLLNMISGIDQPDSGQVWVMGSPLHQMSQAQLTAWRCCHVGIVFQFFHLLPTLTLLQNVILPMDLAGTLSRQQRKTRARDLLASVGLADAAGRLPSQVSGGQQQRAAVARAIANDPPLIVADEPTGNLDAATADAVFELFCSLQCQGRTLIMATHNETLASAAGRQVTILNGRLTHDACRDDRFEHPAA